ncbi:hypothetical protein Micbo1qcDRAFT_235958 [Microdochium bolleyi]|uniref:Xylanolytic transcriptional activator regulatory domain-containing protein n=1 Tax=Microdochium bolleyi TaxID=196109 RepID=A0A136IT81_9PEZI|nr:hypothetical protein Micbo1qcDRAFT_235958 [Microdochium bolleyi]
MDPDTSDSGSPQVPEHPPGGPSRLAVGCDRKKPCGNCKRAGAECVTTLQPRTSAPRQRVRVSTGYDQKINNIEERVEEALGLLRQLATSSPRHHHGLQQPQHQSTSSVYPHGPESSALSSASQKSPERESLAGSRSSGHSTLPLRLPQQSPVEGDSSFVAQTAIASELLNKTIATSPDNDPRSSSDLDSAVKALQSIIKTQRDHNTVYDSFNDGKDPGIYQVWFVGFNVLTFDQLMEHLVRVYFPGPYSESDYIITNGALSCVFNERLFSEDDPEIREQLKAYRNTCDVNLERALSKFPILTPATFENIKALCFGAIRALFTAKPAILWTLTSKALNMCQTLGYHRIQTHRNDAPLMRDQKIWMFWVMYMTSNAVSLRLGRPSVMPDYDISVPVPKPDETSFNRFSNAVVRCMQFSRIQGKIYEVLYSYGALSQPPQIRAQRANMLAEDLRAIYMQIKQDGIRTEERWGDRHSFYIKVEHMSSEMTYHILRTLILRAIPVAPGSNTSLSAECIEAARTTFEMHMRYMVQMDAFLPYDLYFKAILLYMPFTPYLVLFCHVIETSDPSDFERLRAFNASIEPCELKAESCRNLRQLFQSLFHVAKVYIESRGKTGAGMDMSGANCDSTPGHQVRDINNGATGSGVTAPEKANRDNGLHRSGENSTNVQLDAYLRQMGMLPPQDWNQAPAPSLATPYSEHDSASGNVGSGGMMLDLDLMTTSDDYYGIGAELPQHASYLADWFTGNQQIMSMMDENVF